MRYLVFTNTPAHVHLYRNAVAELQARGHDVLVLGRDDGPTTDLLEYYDLPHEVYGRRRETKRSLLVDLPKHYLRIFRLASRYDPDLIFGMGGYASPTGLVTRTPVIAIQDAEPHTLDYTMSRPIVRAFLTPHAFSRDLGPKHYRFNGFKENAYLHPDVYDGPGDIRARLGLDPDEPYVLLRFNGFGAYHDVGQSGFDREQRAELVERLGEHAAVIISSEARDADDLPSSARPFDIHPAHIHDALAEAALLVADTQTMVMEAALLGTPAIRSNSFVGDSDMGNFVELQEQGLVRNVAAFEDVIAQATEIVSDSEFRAEWKRRRDEYVADLDDLTDLIVDVATNEDPVARLEVRANASPPLSIRRGGTAQG